MATAVGMVDKTHALAYQNAIFLTKEFDVTVSIEGADLCGRGVQSFRRTISASLPGSVFLYGVA